MKRNYKLIIPIVLLAGILVSFNLKVDPEDPKKDKVLVSLLRHVLTKWHYEPEDIDDAFSVAIHEKFIETLDPTKRYFLQSDVDEFSAYKFIIDDQIKNEDLTYYHIVYNRFNQRIQESKNYYKVILQNPFDFTKDEIVDLDYEKQTFSKNQNELIKNWQKQLKFYTISRLHDNLQEEIEKKKEDSTYVSKSFEELEKISRDKTSEYMDDFYSRVDDLNHNDWFATFINVIAEEFDPHTTYLAPSLKKRFDQSMSGKLEGIGARLQKKNDYTKVVEIISGGPAWRNGELEVGDLIIKVAQGEDEPLDIVGMRLDDAIEYIKGKKGTEVRLTLKKIDGSTKVISIIRDVVELEETFVKSSLVKKDDRTFGVINLPKFYIDFSEKTYRNSATDMAKEIENLKKENIEGLLIDLRNNGGGSLKTAIDIAGLFIDKGPVVQVKYRDANAKIKSDNDNGKISWDGPLVVLVNELSASASEIFAAAMQDYKRAIIVGGKHTYGKGTVQNVVDLNQYYTYGSDLGALKMTIQKFYRINGGSTQLKGVTSDIMVPSRYTYLEIGERDLDNPLKFDSVAPASYTFWDNYQNYYDVIDNSKKRISDNPQFILINENAKFLKENQDDTVVYLNYEKFKEDFDFHSSNSTKFNKISEYKSNLTFTSPLYEIPLMEADSVFTEKRVAWHKNMSKDIYLEEALTVLSELKIKNQKHLVKN